MVAVVVLDADSPPIKVVKLVRSWAWHVHPFVDALGKVSNTEVHGPVARENVPPVEPPALVEIVHPVPVAVNVVPADCMPNKFRNNPLVPKPPHWTPLEVHEKSRAFVV